MKNYEIPVEWSVYDTVTITANSAKEAIEIFNKTMDDIPLGTTPEYIDGSYKSSYNDEELLAYVQDSEY